MMKAASAHLRAIALIAALMSGCNALAGNEPRRLDEIPDSDLPDASVPVRDGGSGDGFASDSDASLPCSALQVEAGQYAEIPDDDALDLVTPPVTVEAWVWRMGPPELSFIVGHGTYESPTSGWDLALKEDPTSLSVNKTVLVSRTFAASVQASAFGPAPSAATRWTHVAAVRTTAETRLYVDGTRVNGADPPQNADPYPGVLRIGASSLSGAPYPFLGLLDEIRISSSARYSGPSVAPAARRFAMDAETVALWHFDLGAATKDAAGKHDLVLVGGANVRAIACDAYGAP